MIVAAIPVKNQLRWTAPLVEHLLVGDKVDEVWVYDNGSTDETRDWVMHRKKFDNRLKYRNAKGMGIYDMWNSMIHTAATEYRECSLAILNNDIRLHQDALWHMARLLREDDCKILAVDPSRPAISTRSIPLFDGVITPAVDPYVEVMTGKNRIGWAFMVQAEWWADQEYAIHPDYKIWYGDDDLYRRIEQRGGKIGWARGIGCDHAIEQSDGEIPDKVAITDRDRAIFDRMWP